jgi:hypothetical protein
MPKGFALSNNGKILDNYKEDFTDPYQNILNKISNSI